MNPGSREPTAQATELALAPSGSFERYFEHVSAAFAVTRGPEHVLVYTNSAFRNLMPAAREAAIGRPILDAFPGQGATKLTPVLDRAFRSGVVARDRRVDGAEPGAPAWSCTVWPEGSEDGGERHLIIELREAIEPHPALGLQRQIAERMLLSALRERDVAQSAEASRRGAAFLAAASRRLAESLDERTTLDSMARLSLPHLGAWCIVDVIDHDGTMRRLGLIHPNPAKQALLAELDGRWSPEPNDPFGAPAALRGSGPTIVADGVDAVLDDAAHDSGTRRILREVGVGVLLTIPLVAHDRLIGAVTFVSGERDHVYSDEDVALAEDLASRSAMALDSARLHGEALTLKAKAEAASQAKSAFLRAMSHELRTPLNAIGGYVELLGMGLRGPVTDAQHADLARIRSNQRHLLALITDVLNLVRAGSGRLLYEIGDVVATDALAAAVALVEPLILEKIIVYDVVECDPTIVARGDPEKVTQILVNLLSNAIKFTPRGGQIAFDCEVTDDTVRLNIADTGVGIPADKLEAIFDPFFQVYADPASREEGVGLGLAISRDLARAMHGDVTVESVLGHGARFTLVLPRAGAPPKGERTGTTRSSA
ncbi:MAG: ATP-binding protein [Gemmatimonadaceae bacterium]